MMASYSQNLSSVRATCVTNCTWTELALIAVHSSLDRYLQLPIALYLMAHWCIGILFTHLLSSISLHAALNLLYLHSAYGRNNTTKDGTF